MAINGLTWVAGVLGFVAGGLGWLWVTILEIGAWALVAPGRRLGEPSLDPVPGELIEAEGTDGVKLAGLWHAAAAERSTGRTAVLIHGFAEHASALQARVEALTSHGWNAVSIDLRGYGHSGGGFTTFGGREAGDVGAWVDLLAARVGPSLRVALWGRSMGAAIAAGAAAEDRRITALVLESPYDDLNVVVASIVRRRGLPLSRFLARRITRRAARLAGVSLTDPSPLALASRISAPALLVHGAIDPLVPLADAQLLAEAFPTRAPLIEVEGAGHADVVEVGGNALLGKVLEFLDRAVPSTVNGSAIEKGAGSGGSAPSVPFQDGSGAGIER